MSSIREPAIKSYFFDKGYRDLGRTITESWTRNLESSAENFGRASLHSLDNISDGAQRVFWWAAGISVVVFGTVVFALTSLLHVVLLGTVFLLIYAAFTVLLLIEWCYMAARSFFTACPSCHEKFRLPEYLCPSCGAVHCRLTPSSYGILRRTCQCGESLPATFFLNRGRLTSRCPNPDCHEFLDRSHTESRKAFIPIVGGPAVGKSAYLFAAVRTILSSEAPARRLDCSFVEEATRDRFDRVTDQLDHGEPPSKTIETLPHAFNLELRNHRGAWARLLYLYDPAGEAYVDAEGLVLHKYHGYPSGLIFLIDPFSIPEVRRIYAHRLPAVEGKLKPSSLLVEDALARVLISLESHFGLGKTARVRAPAAVVVTKIDAFDLEDRVGERAVARELVAKPELDAGEAASGLVRRSLLSWDQADFVQQVEARFRTVRYFACSSLGRMPDDTDRSFQARGVIGPLVWLLDTAEPGFLGKPAAA